MEKLKGLKLSTVLPALFVRALLILHNILAVWRVVISRKSSAFWGLASGNILTVAEAVLVVRYNGGTEWKWWCPCFLIYLLTTLPSLWLLQLTQYEHLIQSTSTTTGQSAPETARLIQPDATLLVPNMTNFSVEITTPLTIVTTVASTAISNTTDHQGIATQIANLLDFGESTWIVIIQESLVYLLVVSRWLLPRGEVSREALADLLLEFLAIASDIMELYAVFDEDVVQSNLRITYAILVIWSMSFAQFVPTLVHKHKYRHLLKGQMPRIHRACGQYFPEVTVTSMSIILQDGPFLCLRLVIMVQLELVTYSLVFFVLKNIVTLLLLFYRLTILCVRLPCCYYEDGEMAEVDSVDFSRPVAVETVPIPLKYSSEPHSGYMSYKLPVKNGTL